MKIDESNYDTVKKVMKITGEEYEILWADAENIEGYMFDEEVLKMVEDLIVEVGHLEETNEDIIQDRNENYEPKKFDPYKEYGISEDNFH